MKQITLLNASLGTISHGTLRTQDLLSEFISELEWQVNRNGNYFSIPENFGERDKLASLIGEAQDCFSEDGDEITGDKEDIAEELVNESLPNALQQFCGPYVYFGAHQGDGSDFGFWPCVESIEELPTVEDSDAAKELGEDCKSVNDHGNVTVYSGAGEVVLELV
jgi:hypothetical protein